MAFRYVKRSSARAKHTKGVSYVAKGKKPKLGSGKRSAALAKAISKRKGAKDVGAVVGSIGRKLYGQKKMTSWSVAGRKRAAAKRKARRK